MDRTQVCVCVPLCVFLIAASTGQLCVSEVLLSCPPSPRYGAAGGRVTGTHLGSERNAIYTVLQSGVGIELAVSMV